MYLKVFAGHLKLSKLKVHSLDPASIGQLTME